MSSRQPWGAGRRSWSRAPSGRDRFHRALARRRVGRPLNTAAADAGRSATIKPRSNAPAAVFRPALTPAKRNPRTSAGSRSTFIQLSQRSKGWRDSLAVAAFVLLARSTWTGIVAAHLVFLALGGRRRRCLALIAVAHH